MSERQTEQGIFPFGLPFLTLCSTLVTLALAPVLTGTEGPVHGLAAQASGEISEEPTARAAQAHRIDRAETEIRIDGRLDEPAWAQATPITDFRQEEPVEGAKPSERTEVYVLYDDDYLYIGAILYDSEPDGILAHQRQRNSWLGSDDRFRFILDTFRDGRTGYLFETNPAGVMGDALITGSGTNDSWDGIWDVRTRITDEGWIAEIRIPFRTLNFDPTLDTWGINFQRTIRRKNEEVRWSGWRRNQSLTRPTHAGVLTGLEGISQGMGLEATPYVSGNWTNAPALADPRNADAKVGMDLEYSITPSLRAAATVNTDFAEVEADDRLVELTRFPSSLPEQRPFFLENAGVFNFAPRQGVNPFFSRRIGLVDGEEIPIHLGTRLGGQAGDYELGLFQVRTGSGEAVGIEGTPVTVPSEDFTAARVRRGFFTQSAVGGIYTRRATHANDNGEAPPDRHTAGMDFDLYTSEFLDRYNLQLEGFFLWHSDPVAGGGSDFADRRARGLRFNFPNDLFRVSASLRDFGEEFNPALGFQNRRGFRRFQPTVGFEPRPESVDWIRQLEWELRYEYLESLEGQLLTRETDVRFFGVDFESGDRLTLNATRLFERLRRPFNIHDDVVIPEGGYNTTEWRIFFRSAGQRALSTRFSAAHGGFWTGDRTRLDGQLTVRPVTGVRVSTEYERNEVRLPEGGFDTNLVRLEADWHATPFQSLTTSLQYDDVTDAVGLFARGRWTVRPGNDIFLVYSHNWQNEADRLFDRHLSTISQGAAIKVNYTYRF